MRTTQLTLLGAFALFVCVAESDAAVINEVFIDDAAPPNGFIELFGQPGESLDGLSLLIIDNDNGGNTSSPSYRRVNAQFDFVVEAIPGDGYYVLGSGPELAGIVDKPVFNVGVIQSGSQTYALVHSMDIEYDAVDTDQLTQTSIDAIGANAVDIIAVFDDDIEDLFDFEPLIPLSTGASRIPNGVDTDTPEDWQVFTPRVPVTLGDDNTLFATPAESNKVPEPASVILALLGLAALAPRLSCRAAFTIDRV